jgi:Na+-exporting ATPase
MEDFASQGLRVLALASRVAPSHLNYEKELDRNQVECDLTFRGLIGLYDPPRAESAASVKECRQAGIEVHMLTSDHPGTARSIAIDVGILPPRERLATLPKDVADALVMTAGEFDKLSDDQIDQLPQLLLVVARCALNTKVRMIEALHGSKRFAAMVSFNPSRMRVSC